MALIVAPVISSARSAGIGWRTVIIPVAVALLIWSKLPIVSSPILYILLGGIGGWWWLSRHQRKLRELEDEMRKEEEEKL